MPSFCSHLLYVARLSFGFASAVPARALCVLSASVVWRLSCVAVVVVVVGSAAAAVVAVAA